MPAGIATETAVKSLELDDDPLEVSSLASAGSAQVVSSAFASVRSGELWEVLWLAKRSSDSTAAESGQSVTTAVTANSVGEVHRRESARRPSDMVVSVAAQSQDGSSVAALAPPRRKENGSCCCCAAESGTRAPSAARQVRRAASQPACVGGCGGLGGGSCGCTVWPTPEEQRACTKKRAGPGQCLAPPAGQVAPTGRTQFRSPTQSFSTAAATVALSRWQPVGATG